MARFRLPVSLPVRPPRITLDPTGELALVIPACNEADRIGHLIGRVPRVVNGLSTRCIVVDDGSTDETAFVSLAAGAKVISHEFNRGLGAAIRTGLAAAVADGYQVIAFCDGDGEYSPEELAAVTTPIVAGVADYVVGSRFAGVIHHMRPHRRLGNVVLSRWVRWMVRLPITDGQSGFRALSRQAAADAELIHDYNYAQILTIDLVAKGYGYAEVPISYVFRSSGRSFVRLVPYLRRVIPAVLAEIRTQSSTT